DNHHPSVSHQSLPPGHDLAGRPRTHASDRYRATVIPVGQYPRPVGISRRAVIIGSATLGASGGLGLWALLADARLGPGRSVAAPMLGRCNIVSNPPEADPGKVLKSSFSSPHRKRTVRYQVAFP